MSKDVRVSYSKEYIDEVQEAIWDLLQDVKLKTASDVLAMIKILDFFDQEDDIDDLDLSDVESDGDLYMLWHNHNCYAARDEMNKRELRKYLD